MGTHCSSELDRGHIFKSETTIMKLLLLTVFVAVAYAEDEAAAKVSEPTVEPEAPTAVAHIAHPFYGWYGHQLNWPGFRAPGFSSQCFGCRHFGKRSAEAEADAEPGYYGYPYYGYGHYYGLGYGYGHALPGHSYTHVHRGFGKRSAEADAEPGYYGYPYGFYGYPYGYRYRAYGPGIAGHPSGTSYVHTSGAAGK